MPVQRRPGRFFVAKKQVKIFLNKQHITVDNSYKLLYSVYCKELKMHISSVEENNEDNH
jgi:hypothetical protein